MSNKFYRPDVIIIICALTLCVAGAGLLLYFGLLNGPRVVVVNKTNQPIKNVRVGASGGVTEPVVIPANQSKTITPLVAGETDLSISYE